MRHLGPEWSYAGHNSSVAFGTWNFSVDIQKPVDDWHFYVLFISETFDNDWLTNESMGSMYAVGFFIPDSGDHEIRLVRGDHELGPLWMGYYYQEDIVGWNNIIVTREPSGQFYVYLNDKLILGAKNMDRTASERFYFASQGGPAIDNVSVSNTIVYDKAPPEWTKPSDQMIDARTDFSYDLNATDYSGIDQ